MPANDYFIEPGFVEPGFVEVVVPPPSIAVVLFVEADVTVAWVEPNTLFEADALSERETAAITRKFGSFEPWVFVCRTGDGEPRDLTDIASVEIRLRLRDRLSTAVETRVGTVASPVIDGRIEYEPTAGDFDGSSLVLGEYDVVLVLTNSGGDVLIYPQGGTLRLRFEEALAP